jgi:hypothetical protein
MCFGIFQLIVDNPQDEPKLQGALMTSLMRDWREADLDDTARERIMDEAAKLFGGGRRASFGGGGRSESRPKPREDKPADAPQPDSAAAK